MNTEILTVLAIVVAAGAALYFFWYLPKRRKDKQQVQQGCADTHVSTTAPGLCIPREWAYQIDRPDGGVCVVEEGVRPDEETLAIVNARIISGLQRMIDATRAVFPDWTNKLTTGEYTIMFVRKMATNMDGTPALVVGEVQTAGTVINTYLDGSRRGTQYIVLPTPDDWLASNYLPYLEQSVYNEGEHDIEYNNEFAVFVQFIGAGDVHPHRQPVSLFFSEYNLFKTNCKLTMRLSDTGVELAGTKTVVK